MTGTQLFLDVFLGLQHQQFYKIDWIRKKPLVKVANLATCCHDDYDVLLEVLGTLRECYVSSLLGLTTFPPKEKTPGRCCQSGYLLLWWLWCTIGGLGTLRKCYVSSPVAKTLVLDWKSWLAQVFLDVFLGLTLTGPKKASQIQQFYIIDWIREKTPGRCCQSGYLLLWWLWCTIGGLGTLRKCYVSSPVAKALVLDWKSWLARNCFWMSSWGSPLLGPKKLQNQQFI